MRPIGLTATNLAHICQVLSAQYGVKIEVNGTSAFVAYDNEGNTTINIPALCIDDPDYLTKVRGFLDHEAGHVRFTHTGVTNEIEESPRRHDYRIHKDFLNNVSNIFEDVYVERKMSEAFPGCSINLEDLVGVVFKDYTVYYNRKYTQFDYICNALLFATRSAACPRYAPMFDKYIDDIAAYTDKRLIAICREFGQRAVATCNSTKDNWDLAFEFLYKIEEFVKDEQQQRQGNDQQQGQGNDQQQRQGNDQQQRQGNDQQQGQGNDQQQGQDKSGTTLDDISLAQMDALLSCGVVMNASIGNEIRDSLNADAKKEEWKQKGGRNTVYTMDTNDRKGYQFLPIDNIAGAMSVASALSARLFGLLQTRTITRGDISTRGRLDYNRLHRLSVGNARIFRSKTEKLKLNTEIVIAVDNSTSMQTNRKNIVTGEALYGLLACLKRLPGVTVEAFGFGGTTISPLIDKSEPLSPYTRLHPQGNGGTVCGGATNYALSRFDLTKDTRKLYFILTDGDTADMEVFKNVLDRMRGAGIEVFGIGIKDPHLSKYMSDTECRIINDLSELPEAMFSLLEKRLVA